MSPEQPADDESGRRQRLVKLIAEGKVRRRVEPEAYPAAMDHLFKAGKLHVAAPIGPYERSLSSAFPFGSSSLDWSSVPGAVDGGRTDPDNRARDFAAFLRRMVGDADPDQTVYVIGDGLFNVTIEVRLGVLIGILPEVIAYPQCYYVFPFPVTWCASLTFVDDMLFGFAP